MLFVLAIFLFVLLVVVHEFGHYIIAKKNGVEVEEFGIGFPPRLFSKRFKNDKTIYSINLIPLGGFVQLKGENDMDKRKGSFGAASIAVKSKIMMAGVAMNLIVAYLLFTVVALFGMPQLVCDQFSIDGGSKVIRQPDNEGVITVGTVQPNTPAQRNGLLEGDEIISINGRQIDCVEQVPAITKENAGREIEVVTRRGNQTINNTIRLNQTRGSDGYLGISPDTLQEDIRVTRYTWSAPIVAGGVVGQLTKLTFNGLWSAIKGLGSMIAGALSGNNSARTEGASQASSQVTGPVGVVRLLRSSSTLGIGITLMLIAYISLALAIMNILPIPALDGGKLFTTMIYRVLKKDLTPKAEKIIYGSSFAFLILLVILITIIDVRR